MVKIGNICFIDEYRNELELVWEDGGYLDPLVLHFAKVTPVWKIIVNIKSLPIGDCIRV